MKAGFDTGLNVFAGPGAAEKFLRPDNKRPTPFVELTDCVKKGASTIFQREVAIPKNVRFFGKLTTQGSLLNVKAAPAFLFLERKYNSGELKGKKVIIAPSSGGFASSVGLIAPQFGDYEVVGIVPGDLPSSKELMLRFANVFPWVHNEIPGDTGIDLACRLGEIEGCITFNQYADILNPLSHKLYTTKQIWQQTHGTVSAVVAGMGTSGTCGGAAAFFLDSRPPVVVAGGYLREHDAVPGLRTMKRIEEQVQLDFRSRIRHIEITQLASYEAARWVSLGSGCLGGPSSGGAIAAAIKLVEDTSIDELTNSRGEAIIVIVFGDLPYFYLDKFTTVLESRRFPQMPRILRDRLAPPLKVPDYQI